MKKNNFLLLFVGIVFFSHPPGARADVLDNWTTNQVTTNSFGLTHVVYGNGVYVAVAEVSDFGAIYSSADGINWIKRYSDNNGWGFTLAYTEGKFVGAGGWEYIISADGTNWTVLFLPQQSSTFPYGDMTSDGSRYVLVGNLNGGGTIFSSANGTNWTQRIASPAIGGPIASVVFGNLLVAGLFVAVGDNDGYEYTSLNGTTWTRRSIPGGSQISFAKRTYFVPLNNRTNLISTDGQNWSQWPTGLTNQLGKISYAHGIYLARAGSSLATSSDGTNWIQYPQLLPGASEVASDGNRLVTAGKFVTNVPLSGYANGFAFASGNLVNTRLTNNSPSRKVVLSGLVGRNYQIQSTDALGAGSNWRTNTALQLTNTPYLWTDSTATNSTRFYRGVLMP